jgi:hypothetical protein
LSKRWEEKTYERMEIPLYSPVSPSVVTFRLQVLLLSYRVPCSAR